MIDIHSHVIPGISDEPDCIDESLQLLESALQNGINTVIATPHHNRSNANDKHRVIYQVHRLQQAAKKQDLPINLLTGLEICMYDTLLEDYKAGNLLTLASSRYMLIEFPAAGVPLYAERIFYELEMLGIKPIIAHPERNADFIKSPDKLYNLIQKGALAQLTGSSLLGLLGRRIQVFSRKLINANLVHFIATDAHNTRERPFNMREACKTITSEHGSKLLDYFENNARMVIEDKAIYTHDAKQVVRKKIFGMF